ncbi:MAG: hypothetical protein K2Y39_06570 [Candidatus Obscuribacterales bacterium]|nr:hypothetical protein [Candidatus Obscuribacterales bacterium]
MKLSMRILAAAILVSGFAPAVNADIIFDPHDFEKAKKLNNIKKDLVKKDQDKSVTADEKTQIETGSADAAKDKDEGAKDKNLKRSSVMGKQQTAIPLSSQNKQVKGGSVNGKKPEQPSLEQANPWYDPNFIAIALMTGYAFGVLLETPVLMAFLSACHSFKTKLKAGFLLTACTYPFVIVLMPRLINPELHNTLYLAVTETLVPIAECAVFWFVFHRPMRACVDGTAIVSRHVVIRDFAVIVAANLFSFGAGELISFYLTKL